MEKKYDYIIIGGGIAGLHIGALLSQHGEVLILEKDREIGGRARVVNIDGFKLDYGAHPIRFGPNSALAKSLNEIEKPIEFIEPGKFWVVMKDGTKTIYPSGGIFQILRSDLVPFFKTLGFIIKVVKKWDLKKIEELYDVSLAEWFDQINLHHDLRRYLTIASSGVQVCPFPERSSAGELLHNIRRIFNKGSIYYPKGGWSSIFSQFRERIEENNGEIWLNSKVDEIIVQDSTAVGVKIGDKSVKGNIIVNTIPVQKLFNILDENLCSEDFVEKCKNIRPTAGVSIDFCLSEAITDMDFFFLEDPLSFGFVPSNLENSNIAPDEKSIMTFFRPVNVEDIKNKSKSQEIFQEFKEKIYQTFPRLKEKTLHERPLFLEMVDGVEINTEQHKFTRLGNTVHKIENLYLTGDSVGGEGAGGDVGHTSVRDCYYLIQSK
ncbi:MAG: FAD-dependent oxidoreductase [Promethearchaeia archaeon]